MGTDSFYPQVCVLFVNEHSMIKVLNCGLRLGNGEQRNSPNHVLPTRCSAASGWRGEQASRVDGCDAREGETSDGTRSPTHVRSNFE